VCTLTFLPGLPLGGFLLAHNRDESLARGPGLPPVAGRVGGALVLAPRDSDAGGTWLGVDERGRCLAILNGDRPPAAPAPADARSRGLLVLELLADARQAAVRAALERHVAAGTLRSRPFKLAVAEPGAPGAAVVPEHGLRAPPAEATLLRIVWDGARLAFDELSGPQCLVSSTFASEAVAAARQAAFARWLATLPADRSLLAHTGELAAAARAFHAGHAPGAPLGDAFSVCMHRPDARTVSRTLLLVGPRELRMEYAPGWPCAAGESAVATLPRRFGA
jgi:hypothetical protein